MSVNIYDSANQVASDLKEMSEFKALEAAFTAMKEDSAAFELFSNFQNLQMTLQQKQMQGQEITEEDVTEVQTMAEEVHAVPVIQALMDQEQAFSNIINDLNRIIMKPVQDLYQLG